MIPKYGYLFQYDKYKKILEYNKGYKCSNAYKSTTECIYELKNGNIASCGNDLTIKI